MKRSIILFFVFFQLSSLLFGQSKAVSSVTEKYTNGVSLYLYHSTLRVLHPEPEKGFNELIRDLNHIRFFFLLDQAEGISIADNFIKDIQDEGYEELMTMNEAGIRVRFYMIGEAETASFIALIAEKGHFIIMEMDGTPNLKYLNTVSDMNFDRLKNVFPKGALNLD